jgi:hypothetical protein
MDRKVVVGGLGSTLVLLATVAVITSVVSHHTTAVTAAAQRLPVASAPLVTSPSPGAAAAPRAIATVQVGAVATPVLPPGALAKQEVETLIVARARVRISFAHLEGPPSEVTSQLMTYREFNARFDPGSRDNTPLDTLFWFVVLKGNITITGAPRQDGGDPRLHADHLWVLVDTKGKAIGTGTFGTSAALDKALANPVPAWTPLPPLTVPK